MVVRCLFVLLLLHGVVLVAVPGRAILGVAADETNVLPSGSLARLTSWVLFSGDRAPRGAPFFAYGYLSQVQALPRTPQADEESSALLSFVIEGKVVDFQRNGPALMIQSQGTLRVFFDPQASRDFTKPESFRSGEEVATYNLHRQVLFNPDGGSLYDRSFASLVSSKGFTVKDQEVDLLRLWGSQLVLRAQANAGNGFPSPLPDYSGAIPYTGMLLVGGERTERVPGSREDIPMAFTVWRQDSSGRAKNWG
jgi:hypothetical protein